MKRWLSSISADKPLAVLTGSSVNALSFARSLGRRGVRVLLLDSDRHVAVHTRFVRAVKLPPCRHDPGACVEQLLEIGRLLPGPAVLIPTADRHATLVAENQAVLQPYYHFLALPGDVAARCVSKRFQVELARRLDVPVPETWILDSPGDAARLERAVRFPCIVKPDYSQSGAAVLSGAKLVIAQNENELRDACEALLAEGVPCLVQEIIPGPDTQLVSYLGFWSTQSEEVAFITKRKLRQFPTLYGNGSIQRTEDLPQVAEYSRALLRGLDYRGFAGIEFKHDRRDGSLRFVEINPRSSAMNELAVAAGVDFPWIAYQVLQGQALPAQRQAFEPGVTCVNEEWDLQAFLALRRKGEMTLGEWFRSVRGAHRIIFALDDPLPFIAGLRRAAELLLSGKRL